MLEGHAPDGTHRIHARGQGVGAMSYLGTFCPYVVAPIDAVIKIDKAIPLDKAALVDEQRAPAGAGSQCEHPPCAEADDRHHGVFGAALCRTRGETGLRP